MSDEAESIDGGQRLREARIAAGYGRVTDFAKALGVEPPTVYRIEAGQTPSVATLRRWAEVCGVSMDYLAGRTERGATGTEG